MNKFRNRLTVIFIVFIGLSNITAGIFTISVMRGSQIEALEDSLSYQLQTYLATVDWEYVTAKSVRGEVFRNEARRIARTLGAHVTFLDVDGTILGDSKDFAGEAETNSPELSAVMNGKVIGFDVRRDADSGNQMMYAAVPAYFGKAGVGYVRFGESMAPLNAETVRIALYLGAGTLLILLVTAAIAYRISQNLTDPIEKMTRAAHQIANRNYSSRVFIPNRDEIGQLGQAINKMSESLQEQMTRIEDNERRLMSVLENMISGVLMIDGRGHIVLINRSAEEMLGITAADQLGKPFTAVKSQYELTKLIQECLDKQEHIRDEVIFYYPEEKTLDIHLVPMIVGNEEWYGILVVLHDISAIRRLERVRSEFVANVTHELKTPIAAVKGFAETLLGGTVNDPETSKAFMQIIHDESERLNRLVGDILDLSKIESKRVPLHFTPVELQTFVKRIFHRMSSEADKKKIKLQWESAENVYIEADEDRLEQIFINLVSNAIAYSQEDSRVRVIVEPVAADPADGGKEERVRITVQDYGIGIPKKDLPRIFERFYRVDKARTRGSGGTGLGLSIVKHLVELHKGEIRVESTVGMGTRFIIELPVLQE